MDHVDQNLDVLWRRGGHDPVPEVEDVARSLPCSRDDGLGLALDGRRVGEEHERIEVALEGDALAELPARRSQIDRPIESYARCAGLDERWKRAWSMPRENDRGHLRRQRLQHRMHRLERKAPVRVDRQ